MPDGTAGLLAPEDEDACGRAALPGQHGGAHTSTSIQASLRANIEELPETFDPENARPKIRRISDELTDDDDIAGIDRRESRTSRVYIVREGDTR